MLLEAEPFAVYNIVLKWSSACVSALGLMVGSGRLDVHSAR